MGKILKIALAVGVIAAVTVATGGTGTFAAASFTTGVGVTSAVGITLTSATLAAFIGGAVIGAALAGLGSLLTPDVPRSNSETSARLNKTLNPEEFRKILLGETAAPSDLRYWEAFGTDNKDYDEVIAVATHEIESFGAFYLEDELIPFTGTAATGRLAGNFARHTVVLGSGAVGPTAGNLWNPQDAKATKMTGLAYYVLKYNFDQEKFPRGFPSRYTQVVKGAKVYDPRLDTTRGGSGLHRTDDQSTWEYNDGVDDIGRNPALQVLWYLLGWKINGILVAGIGVDPDDIDFASFITAANDCDSEGYFCDVALSTGDAHELNLNIIAATAGGKVLDTGGRFRFHVSIDDTAVVAAAFDDNDIVGPIEWLPKLSMREQYNSVEGQFVDPATLYQVRTYPKITDASFVTADGFERSVTANYMGVQDNIRVQKLANRLLRRSRHQGGFRAPFNYKAMLVKNWDIVTLSFANFGWVNEKFRVVGQDITTEGIIILTLKEEDSFIYTGVSTVPLDAPAVGAAFDPSAKVAVAGDSVTAIQVSSDGVAATDAIQVDWTAPSSVVLRTDVQYKRAADADWIALAPLVQLENQSIITPLDPDTSYDVRVRHVTIMDVIGDWSVPTGIPLTTLDFTTLEVGGSDANTAHLNTLTYGVFDRAATTLVEVADASAWDIDSGVSRTFIIDVYFDEFDTARQAFWHKRDKTGTNTGWEFRIVGVTDKMEFLIDDPVGGGQTLTSDNALEIEKWYQIAITRTAAGLYKMQINDDIQADSISDNVSLLTAVVMQFGQFSSPNAFKGRLRNAQIWDSVRTQAQITDNRFKFYDVGQANLQGYWLFDEGEGLLLDNFGLSTLKGRGEGTFTWGGPVGTGLPMVGIALTDDGDLNTNRGMDQGDGIVRKIPHGLFFLHARDTDGVTFDDAYDVAPDANYIRGGGNFDGTGLSNTAIIQASIIGLSINATGLTVEALLKEAAGSIVGHIDGDGTGTETAWNSGNGPTNPEWQAGKEATASAWNNTYTFKYTLSVDGFPEPGNMQLGFYTNDNGAGWVLQSTRFHTTSATNAVKAISVSGLDTAGPDGDLYGVDIESVSNATLDDVVDVVYDTATAPAEVTATPSGADDVVFLVSAGVE